MKMIYLSNSRLPTERAHGVQVMKMCEAFVGHGVELELVVPLRLNKIKTDPFDYYGVKKLFKIVKVPCLDLVSIPFGGVGFYIQTASFLLSAKLHLLFKRFDILYTREQLAGIFFKNFIFEIHSLPAKVGWLHKLIWRKARGLVVLTSFIKDDLVRQGVLADKIIVAADAVDLREFDIKMSPAEARKKLNLPLNKKLVGYVGMLRTLGMEKGIADAVKALQRLNNEITLVLVGGFEEDISFYKKMAVDLGVADHALFIGKVPHALVPVYLQAFDVLIAPFPNTTHYRLYMSPLKLFEYMAAGKPLVISDLPAVKEIVNFDSAFFCLPDDVGSLVFAINEALGGAVAVAKAESAHEKVKNYTWEKRTAKILDFIHKI